MVLHVVMYKPKPGTTHEEIEIALEHVKETVETPTPHVMQALQFCNLPDVSVKWLRDRAGA